MIYLGQVDEKPAVGDLQRLAVQLVYRDKFALRIAHKDTR